MLKPTTSRMSRAAKVCGVSVVMAWARMRTAPVRPWRLRKSSEQRIAAPAPQVGGQAIRRVITPGQTAGEFITSSALTTLRNSAIGLLAAWRLALARILAKVSRRVPNSCMCAWPAPPK
ncbi:hypothetical protein D3C80_1227460 [compost metagenome]